MIDCCVTQLKEIHELADYVWWFQRFVLASPFILPIPDFDTTAGTTDLLQTGIQKAGEMGVSTALTMVQKNQKMPDFVDTVQNLGEIAVHKQMAACRHHQLYHITRRGHDIAVFWERLANVYNNALQGR